MSDNSEYPPTLPPTYEECTMEDEQNGQTSTRDKAKLIAKRKSTAPPAAYTSAQAGAMASAGYADPAYPQNTQGTTPSAHPPTIIVQREIRMVPARSNCRQKYIQMRGAFCCAFIVVKIIVAAIVFGVIYGSGSNESDDYK